MRVYPSWGGGGLSYSSISPPTSSDNIRCVSPVSIMDSELAIISEFSSDEDLDLEDELLQVQPLSAPVSPASTVPSLRQVESPSNYNAPAVPIVSSTVASVRSPGTMVAFPTFAGLSGPEPSDAWTIFR